MLTEISLDQAIGKTVSAYEASYTDNQFVLVFTDGTFTTLEASQDKEVCESKLRLLYFGDEAIIAVGIATKEELNKAKDELEAEHKSASEADERRQYERLRDKFEGKDTP